MPKGKRTPDSVKNAIRNDYYEKLMTVDEIAAKYNVHRRRVYDYVKADRHSPYSVKRMRKMTYLSKDEVELILLLLCECDGILKGKNRITAKCIEERMLNLADAMTYYDDEEIEEDERDYGPSNPWDAPGMKVSDFIKGVKTF